MHECSEIHAGMELQGITMNGKITLRGRSWESGLHVLSVNWDHQKVGRLVPRKITLPMKTTSHLSLSKVMVHPALQRGLMPISNMITRCGTMCPVKIVGNPGIVMPQMCVDLTFRPSGMLLVNGLGLICLLTTSMPSIMKMDVALVSVIACVVATVIVFNYSCDGWANMLQAIAAIDWVKMDSNKGGVDQWELLEQFDVAMVTSSSSKSGAEKFTVGSKESIRAVTKSLNLFATSIFSTPPHQKFLGSNVLRISLLHVLRPIARNVWELSRMNVTSWDGLGQPRGQVIEVWSSSTSKPHK
jgi:hypothetical protein